MDLCMAVIIFIPLSSEDQVWCLACAIWHKTIGPPPGSIIGLASGIIKTLASLKWIQLHTVWRTTAVEKEMGSFLQETSPFSMRLLMKKMWFVISNTYFTSYLNARLLFKIFKTSMIQASMLGEWCKDVYL